MVNIPKRYLKITLYAGRKTRKDTKVLSFLDINAKVNFNTSIAMFGSSSEANINITGLTVDKMSYLATSFSLWQKQRIYNTIEIDAGYEGRHQILFSGTIIDAVPSLEGADYSIALKCSSRYDFATVPDSRQFKGKVSVKEICRQIAKDIKAALVYATNAEAYVEDYSYSAQNIQTQLRNLSQTTGLNIYIVNNRLYVTKNGDAVDKIPTLKITTADIIGTPKPNAQGCDISIKMNTEIVTGQPVELISYKFPQLNSYQYYVAYFNHTGETKGRKWQTDVKLIRRNILNAELKHNAESVVGGQ